MLIPRQKSLLCLSAFCLGGWLWLHFSHKDGQTGGPLSIASRLPGKDAAADRSQASTAPDAAMEAGISEDDLQFAQRLVGRWNRSRDAIQEWIHRDLAAALARRKKAAPHYHAVVRSLEEYEARFREANHASAAAMHDFYQADPVNRVAYRKLRDLGLCMASRTLLDDATPVVAELTIGRVAGELLSVQASGPETYGQETRRSVARAEREVYGDEPAARQVEALQTDAEVAAYVQGSLGRYQATYQQILAGSTLEKLPSDYLRQSFYAEQVALLNAKYVHQWNHEVDHEMESLNMMFTMLHQIPSEVSAADAEYRAILTEAAEVKRQVEAMGQDAGE